MGRIQILNFGRGMAAAPTDITNFYDDVAAIVNTTKIKVENLSPQAGIPESKVDFSGKIHKHIDGSLAVGAIADAQMILYPSLTNNLGFVLANQTKLACIAGRSKIFSKTLSSGQYTSTPLDVAFWNTSMSGASFPSGAVPTIILGLDVRSWTVNDSPIHHVVLVSRSSTGFRCLIVWHEFASMSVSFTYAVHYFAFAAMPGTLVDPSGVR